MATLRKLLEVKIKSEVTGLREVAGATDLKAILSGRVSAAGCYLYRDKNQATKNTLINKVSQNRFEYIAVVVVTANHAGLKGAENADDNEEFCDAIQAALLGYEPLDYAPVQYASGELINMANGMLYWQEVYVSSRLIRSV